MSDGQDGPVSDDRIAALVAAAREGRLEEAGGEDRRGARRAADELHAPDEVQPRPSAAARPLARDVLPQGRRPPRRRAARARWTSRSSRSRSTPGPTPTPSCRPPAVCGVLEAADPRTRMLLSSELTLVAGR